VSVHVAAEPETVFPYFTDPGHYVQWMAATRPWSRSLAARIVFGCEVASRLPGSSSRSTRQRDQHRKGWELYLGRLDLRTRGGDPGPDPNT
jgi:uncharacterized protein YndB with AHSA1/START domain